MSSPLKYCVESIREIDVIEHRINSWLEDKGIFQVSPEEKKFEFFNKNKIKFGAYKSESEKTIKPILSLSNSHLLKRRNTSKI